MQKRRWFDLILLRICGYVQMRDQAEVRMKQGMTDYLCKTERCIDYKIHYIIL